MKKTVLSLLISIFLSSAVFSGGFPYPRPDEGMWLPLLIEKLNYADMQRLGLKITAEDIYSVNHSSLKDAIVVFGGGCTGEIVSPEGLLLTNHHCGYGQIQAHSTVEHDYLTNGFWAKSKDQELPNPGLTVKFLVRMEDVSDIVLKDVDDGMTETERNKIIMTNISKIEADAKATGNFVVNVKSFFAGNKFYLLVYEEYKDVRLVGAPPSSIGKFGADTDNWMWPRHTGDFSIFRVYTDKEGKPAEYSPDNIPLKPKKYLNISLKGYKEGDFAMIMGNPGSTDRYLTSFGVRNALEYKNPSIVKIRTIRLQIMREDMDANPAVRIQYASKYARVSNYWKYFQGQSRGLKRLNVYDKKVALESEFQKWVLKSEETIRKYGNVISDFESAYKVLDKYEMARQYANEAIFRGSDIMSLAGQFRALHRLMTAEKIDNDRIKYVADVIKKGLPNYFKDYNLSTDKKQFAAMLELYYKDIAPEFQPDIYATIQKKYKGDFSKYTDYVFSKTILINQTAMELFLDAPNKDILEKDPVFQIFVKFYDLYQKWNDETKDAQNKLDKCRRLYMAGLQEMQKDRKFYPDANFTLRLTYGTVKSYYPSDAVYYNYFTTLDGVMEKEDPNNWEFVVPEKLKQLYETKDYGRYASTDEKGNKIMKTCFLTNTDITGGNSGSPVLDGYGNLIGLAFDGNWEAMSGDIAFETELQRTISVDIRYVLFIIDKFAGAQNLIQEMTIIE